MQIKDLLPWSRSDDRETAPVAAENPIARLQNEMNRAFEGFLSRDPFAVSGGGAGELGSLRSDVVETERGVEITVEAPGVSEEDLEVTIAGDAVTVRGEKKIERTEEKTGYMLSERRYGAFSRTIPLPRGVDAAQAEATFKNGVLTIAMPRTAEAEANVRKIAVRSA